MSGTVEQWTRSEVNSWRFRETTVKVSSLYRSRKRKAAWRSSLITCYRQEFSKKGTKSLVLKKVAHESHLFNKKQVTLLSVLLCLLVNNEILVSFDQLRIKAVAYADDEVVLFFFQICTFLQKKDYISSCAKYFRTILNQRLNWSKKTEKLK